MSRRQILLALLAGAVTNAWAQTKRPYPVDVLRIVVPFAPGGGADIIARKLAIGLTDRLTISSAIVDNRAGASTQVGSRHVATSKPDGSVLLFTTTHHVINPSLYKTLPYDTRKDFTPIALVAASPSLLVVPPSLGVGTVEEFVALARKQPGKLTFSSAGTGGANHLSGELFKTAAHIDMMHVPYSGASQALTAVMGGHVSAAFVTPSSVVGMLQSHSLKALASTGKTRMVEMPDVPTMHEIPGVEPFDALVWFGFYGPRNLNASARQQLELAVKDWLEAPDVQSFLRTEGLTAGDVFGTQFENYVNAEIEKWGRAAKSAKLEKQ